MAQWSSGRAVRGIHQASRNQIKSNSPEHHHQSPPTPIGRRLIELFDRRPFVVVYLVLLSGLTLHHSL